MRLVTVKKCFVKGAEADFKGKTQNTSYIERFNLTLRQRVSYLGSPCKSMQVDFYQRVTGIGTTNKNLQVNAS
jgi:hypothetical protein